MQNLSDASDKFQRDNGITTEDLLPPASTFALALVDSNGNVVLNGVNVLDFVQGLGAMRVARVTFDPSGNTDHRTIAAHALGAALPKNAIITGLFYDVITTFTSATDAATVALKIQSANDLLSAIAISDASNVLDAGVHGGLIGYPNFGADAAHDSQVEVAALFAATYLKLTAAVQITATVAVEALTAGKMNIFARYVLSS